MKMSQTELYDATSEWLMKLGYQPIRSSEREGLIVLLKTDDGEVRCRIRLEAGEKTPPVIHFLARLLVSIPRERLEIVALRLMNMNRGIRFGQFSLGLADGTITYRFTHMLADGQIPTQQWDFCLRQVVWYAGLYGPHIRSLLENPPDVEEEIMRWEKQKRVEASKTPQAK